MEPIKSLYKKAVKPYIFVTTAIGSIVIFIFLFNLINKKINEPKPVAIKLSSGFIYDLNENKNAIILNENKDIIIKQEITNLMQFENFIYGARIQGNHYYFICKYGEDCSQTQNLSELEFIHMLEKENIPKYNYNDARNYKEMLTICSKKSKPC